MRASSLSDARILGLIARYFVPVWMSNDDYGMERKEGPERDELRRIRSEADRLGLPNGRVTVFVVHPDGTPIDSLIVGQAVEPRTLAAMLERVVATSTPPPRGADAIRALRAVPRPAPEPKVPGGLQL